MRQVFMRLSPPLPPPPTPLTSFLFPLYCFVFLACLLFYIIYPFAREVVGVVEIWLISATELGKLCREPWQTVAEKSLSQCLIGEQS